MPENHNPIPPSTDFEILDSVRQPDAHGYPRRSIIDFYGYLEPHIDELDTWVAMPLRLVHSQLAGFELEVGPYSLSAADIHTLRSAIAAYDKALGRKR